MDYLTSPTSISASTSSSSSSSPTSSTESSSLTPLHFPYPSSLSSNGTRLPLPNTTNVLSPSLASTLSDIEGRIKQINDLYAQKTRRLVATVSRLQDENQALKASTKEHNRSTYITTLQNHSKERELIIDVLKEGFGQSTQRNKQEVDEWITKKTLSGPTRFRPKSREELGIEIGYLEQQLKKATVAIEGLETSIKNDTFRRNEDTQRLKDASHVITQQTTLLNDYKARLEYGEKQIQSYQLTVFELNNQINVLKDIETKAKQISVKYTDTKKMLQDRTKELDDCKTEISKLKAYVQTNESNGRYRSNRNNLLSSSTSSSSSPDGKNSDEPWSSSMPIEPLSHLHTVSTLSTASISDLNLNNPQEAEIYVQKLRAHYGREINELRHQLELVRNSIVENNAKRKEEQQEWQKVLLQNENTVTKLKEQHRNELELVRTELQRSLQTMKEENEEDMQILRNAHKREMETIREHQTETNGEDNANGGTTNAAWIGKLRETLQSTQDELRTKSNEYNQLNDKYTELLTKYKTLEGVYDAQKISYDTLLDGHHRGKEKVTELRNELYRTHQENKQYKQELDALQSLTTKGKSTESGSNGEKDEEMNTKLHQLVRNESIRIHHESTVQLTELKEQLLEATKRAEHYEALHLRHEEYMDEIRKRSEDELEAATNACAEAEERAIAAETKVKELEQRLAEGQGEK